MCRAKDKNALATFVDSSGHKLTLLLKMFHIFLDLCFLEIADGRERAGKRTSCSSECPEKTFVFY